MRFHLVRERGADLNGTVEKGCQVHLRIDLGPDERIGLLGDPVIRDLSAFPANVLGPDGRVDGARLFRSVPGHYYWFHRKGNTIECGSSFGGLLPLYYRDRDGRVDIASSAMDIARARGLTADDRSWLLERTLFNYPLFGRTPWKDVRRLPACCKLVVTDEGARVERFFRVEDHFGDGAHYSRADMDELCAVFEQECKLMIPARGFALSFTGGFDGRTLLGAARKLGRPDFTTYGFGAPGESDIVLPETQARALGVPYRAILLDDRYVREDALASALAFMDLSGQEGNLGRPHYHYAARLLAGEHTHIVTGNFGSELFRALHAPGEMMTEHLIDVFSSPDDGWRVRLIAAAGSAFAGEAEELADGLAAYLAEVDGLTPSQRFYRFVFDELFRKYFGPEIVVQSHFLRNRTPFLSLRFVEAVHRTAWAGVHARLFERDRTRRMKGQAFYAAFLCRADPRLYRMPTNKGYAPVDVAERWRLPLLAARSLWKRTVAPERADSNGVGAFLRMHKAAILERYGLIHEGDDLRRLSVRVAWAACGGA